MFKSIIIAVIVIGLANGFRYNPGCFHSNRLALKMVATESYHTTRITKSPSHARSSVIASVTDEDFASKVLDQDGLSLVMFSAPWCGPCKAMRTILRDSISSLDPNSIRIMEINTDYNQEYAMEYQDGKIVADIVGAVPKELLVSKIQKHRSSF
eukprot:gene3175-6262_t